MSKLERLALGRIRELGQVAFGVYEDTVRWNPEKPDRIKQAEMSVAFKSALEEQWRWVDALLETAKAAGGKDG